MSLQLYSHSKQDLEQVVEIVLNKVKNFQIGNSSNETKKEDLITQKEASEFLNVSLPTIILWRKEKTYRIIIIMVDSTTLLRNFLSMEKN